MIALSCDFVCCFMHRINYLNSWKV